MADEKNLFEYNEESIKSLDWKEHIRLRPGMYIGKLGDGTAPDDGVYVLVKEVIDNCIDEYTMGYGKQVELVIEGKKVNVLPKKTPQKNEAAIAAEAAAAKAAEEATEQDRLDVDFRRWRLGLVDNVGDQVMQRRQ